LHWRSPRTRPNVKGRNGNALNVGRLKDAQNLPVGPAAVQNLLVGLGGVGGDEIPEYHVIERDGRLVDELDCQALLTANLDSRCGNCVEVFGRSAVHRGGKVNCGR
jgi:hypothetical protein